MAKGITLSKSKVRERLEAKVKEIQGAIKELAEFQKDNDKKVKEAQEKRDAEYVTNVHKKLKEFLKETDAYKLQNLVRSYTPYLQDVSAGQLFLKTEIGKKYYQRFGFYDVDHIKRELEREVNTVKSAIDELDLFSSDEIPASGNLNYLKLIRF